MIMKKILTLLALAFCYTLSMHAQVEDKADWESDFDDDPQMLEDRLAAQKRQAALQAVIVKKKQKEAEAAAVKPETLYKEDNTPRRIANELSDANTASQETEDLSAELSGPTDVLPARLQTARPTTAENTYEQSEDRHIQFMGLELNGAITEMDTKLASKGVRVSPVTNSLPYGQRLYNGTFSGSNADIIINYNIRTSEVYKGQAIIKSRGKSAAEQLMSEMLMKLDMKYDAYHRVSFPVKDEYDHQFHRYSWMVENGTIDLYTTSSSRSDNGDFFLHVEYMDYENEMHNRADELNDL